jgi:predicted ArsR family transcriptional regulator
VIKTTRQQIIDFLETRQIATASEISLAFHITHANTRRHLNNLVSEGLVQVSGKRKDAAKGRPSRQYQLTKAITEHNLDHLSSALLNRLQAVSQPVDWYEQLAEIANVLIDLSPSPVSKPGLGNRLQACVNHLNRLHYRSRWEAHTESPRLILGHCPYRQIIDNHPELCQMDTALIEQLIGASVQLNAKLEQTPQGGEVCVFLVKK